MIHHWSRISGNTHCRVRFRVPSWITDLVLDPEQVVYPDLFRDRFNTWQTPYLCFQSSCTCCIKSGFTRIFYEGSGVQGRSDSFVPDVDESSVYEAHNYEFHCLCAPPIPEDALASVRHAVDELQACARCGYCSHKYACAGAQQPPAPDWRVLPVLRRSMLPVAGLTANMEPSSNVCRFPRGNRHELWLLHRGVTVTGFRKRLQCGFIKLDEEFCTWITQLLHYFVIQSFQQLPNALIKRCKAVEDLMPDSGHDPAFNNLNANFSFGFIFRFTWPRRQNCDIIMLKHLLVGRVNVRIILYMPRMWRFSDCPEQQVQERHPTTGSSEHDSSPSLQAAETSGLCPCVTWCPENSYDDLSSSYFSGLRVGNANGRSTVINESFSPALCTWRIDGEVVLSHSRYIRQ